MENKEEMRKIMDIIIYIKICTAIIAAYAAAVVAALFVIRRCEDGTADEAEEPAREAFRKWFRFAN